MRRQLSGIDINRAIEKLKTFDTADNEYVFFVHPFVAWWYSFKLWMLSSKRRSMVWQQAAKIEKGKGLHDKRTKAWRLLKPYHDIFDYPYNRVKVQSKDPNPPLLSGLQHS